jgi:hypothetical protein
MYSTIAALRANNLEIDVARHPELDDPWCTAIIARADRWVRIKVQPLTPTIPNTDPPTCEEPITALAEYCALYYALITMYSRGRSPRNDEDITGAREDRDELLGQIERREVNLTYLTNLTTNYREDGRKPAFGQGRYGEYETDDTPGDDPDEHEIREDT